GAGGELSASKTLELSGSGLWGLWGLWGVSGVSGLSATGRIGMRSTAPQAHPSSGCGHWSWRPQAGQRTVTQSSAQVRWVIGTGATPRRTGGATGSPQLQGKAGGA
ncbi:hypothetical protein, partial [Streptomyces sp. E11-3]|uniref:hypothetical protein n=1 Tax=Streptomyces sp. E11-3 TaxID=3110112 RepID=UPI003980587C